MAENTQESETHYWLHRISHEWGIMHGLLEDSTASQDKNGQLSLFENGFLSTGWFNLVRDCPELRAGIGQEEFRELTQKWPYPQGRWNLFRFLSFQKGDVVLVPLPGGLFALYKVVDPPFPARDFSESLLNPASDPKLGYHDGQFTWDGKRENVEGKPFDIGFVVPVKLLKGPLKRSQWADSHLYSRMKVRFTTGQCDDLKDNIRQVLARRKTYNFQNDLVGPMLKLIERSVKDNDFEKLIKYYFEKIGAKAEIQPRNYSGKPEGGDVDVIATFDDLQFQVFVQAKRHEGWSNAHAVEQLHNWFKDYKNEGYTVALWAITTGKFDKGAQDFAKLQAECDESDAVGSPIRLIDGEEFCRMLLAAGITDVGF